MRVITGLYKGRKIQAPEDKNVRPTTDFAKTGLFNILENHFSGIWENTNTLDLFAGFGSLALEALSRGVKNLTVNDKNPKNIQIIQKNFERIGVQTRENQVMIEYFQEDALNLVKRLANKQKFDLIFVDPPYLYPEYQNIFKEIFKGKLLADDGIVVVEHDQKLKLETEENCIDQRKYGKVNFSFFTY